MATLAGRCWAKTLSFTGSSFRTFLRCEPLSASVIIGDGSSYTMGMSAERKYCIGESFGRLKLNNENFQLLRKRSLSTFATAPFTRRFCSFNNEPRLDLFPDEPKIKRPSPLRLMKVFWNFFTYYWNYDRSFNTEEFAKGTLQAMLYVSSKLSKSEFESLEGLIVPDTHAKVRNAVSLLSEQAKELLIVEAEDVQFHYIDSVQYRQESSGKTYLDVMAVFYYMHKSKDFADRVAKGVLSSATDAQKYAFRVVSVNIGFTKKISPELDNDWVINKINYFQSLSGVPMPQ